MKKSNAVFGEPIYSYTRANAIQDGELMDVSAMAKQAGFKIPVAVTRAVWNEYVEWTDEDDDRQTMQDQSGRLWDLLWMLYVACKQNKEEFYVCYRGTRDFPSKKDKNRCSP